MNTRTKTVLLFQLSRFQAEIWRSILWEHNIIVIWEQNYTEKQNSTNYFQTLELKPNLLIIDLKIDNAYELCRVFKQNYPESKIVLTTNIQDGYSSAIRRWAVNQGVDELLIDFQQKGLFNEVIVNINCVLKLLESPLVEEERLIKSLNSLGYKNLTVSSKKNDSQSLSPVIEEPEKTVRAISPMVRTSLILLIILLITTLLLDGSTLLSFSSVQALQRKLLAKTNQPKNKGFREIEKVPQGIFNYGGSTTWASIRNVVDTQIAQEYPEFKLRYLPAINATPGSGTGIRMLLEGELDFSQSSRSLKQAEYIQAHQKGFSLKEYHIAIDAIAIGVHPSLPISGLTLEQLKKIYLGEITNWKELNGPDLEIRPFSRREEDGGTPEFFDHHILDDKPFGDNVEYVYSTTEGLRKVMDTPGGIYYASAPQIIVQCQVKPLLIASTKETEFIPPYVPPAVLPENCPHERNRLNITAIENATYPLTRYLSVIVKQDGGRAQNAGEAYTKLLLTEEIQTMIKEVGFIPIN